MNVRDLVNAEKDCREMIERIRKAEEVVSIVDARVYLNEEDAQRLVGLLDGYSFLLGHMIDRMEVDV